MLLGGLQAAMAEIAKLRKEVEALQGARSGKSGGKRGIGSEGADSGGESGGGGGGGGGGLGAVGGGTRGRAVSRVAAERSFGRKAAAKKGGKKGGSGPVKENGKPADPNAMASLCRSITSKADWDGTGRQPVSGARCAVRGAWCVVSFGIGCSCAASNTTYSISTSPKLD